MYRRRPHQAIEHGEHVLLSVYTLIFCVATNSLNQLQIIRWLKTLIDNTDTYILPHKLLGQINKRKSTNIRTQMLPFWVGKANTYLGASFVYVFPSVFSLVPGALRVKLLWLLCLCAVRIMIVCRYLRVVVCVWLCTRVCGWVRALCVLCGVCVMCLWCMCVEPWRKKCLIWISSTECHVSIFVGQS